MVINPEIVIITSQYTPEQIWEGDKETQTAIRRRTALVSLVLPDESCGSGSGSVSTEHNTSFGYKCHITYELN